MVGRRKWQSLSDDALRFAIHRCRSALDDFESAGDIEQADFLKIRLAEYEAEEKARENEAG